MSVRVSVCVGVRVSVGESESSVSVRMEAGPMVAYRCW